MARPTWDEYFMELAHIARKRSTCVTRHTGAVLVKENRVIATGYNGTPAGTRHCDDGACPRCSKRVNSEITPGTNLDVCICCHAEENAILQAAQHGTNSKGSTLYTTYTPCIQCAKMIINSGIKKVVAYEDYPDDIGTALLKEAQVELVKFSDISSKKFD